MLRPDWESFGFAGHFAAGPWIPTHRNGHSMTVAPPVDLADCGEFFRLSADMPGVAPENVGVVVEKGQLIISGHREPNDEPQPQALRRERRATHFYRELTLGDAVDAEAIEASYENGVLVITLPKQPEQKARAIPVSQGS